MDWTEGYYTGQEYTSGYYPNLGPAHLRFACRAAGIHCRIPDEPVYLELGMGRGVSVNIHAAAGDGAYWGVDFNPAHMTHAESLAQASGANLQLSEESFAAFAARPDLPMFDVIALHGVWSWISAANRAVIIDLIRARLRPGGVVYVSYNAQPGWAAMGPIRHLLELGRDQAAIGAGTTGDVARARAFLEDVVGANPRYFLETRPAAGLATRLQTKDENYLAHEFLNADWSLFFFSEVAADMARAKLSYVTSARVLDRINDLNLTPEGVALLDRTRSPDLREAVRDFLVNERFRPDIYVKGMARMTIPEQDRLWDAQTFVLCSLRDEIDLGISGALGDGSLPAEMYGPVLDALAADDYRPKTLSEIVDGTRLATLHKMDAIGAVLILIGKGVLRPARVPSPGATARCRAYNAHVLDRALLSSQLRHLASPVLEGGLPCPRPLQMFLRAWQGGVQEPSAIAAETWRVFQTTNERAMKNNQEMITREDNLAVLTEMAERFIDRTLPLYRALGID